MDLKGVSLKYLILYRPVVWWLSGRIYEQISVFPCYSGIKNNNSVKTQLRFIKPKHLIIVSLFILTNLVIGSESSALSPATDSLFLSGEVIRMELRCDYGALEKDRTANPQYRDGTLKYKNPDGTEVRLKVKVMVRGNFRRNPDNCNFPPLAINFKKDEVENTLFENQNKLKLVTTCQYDRYVVDEYLIYKMYNLVTERSFKVRLVNIDYFDTVKGRKLFTGYSFFIEDEDRVAERNNSTEVKKLMTPYALESESFRKMAFFQYMTGNKDWYVTSQRNLVLMQPNDSTQLPYAVPYDFDFSAFIDADYTKPRNVPDNYLASRRVYKGLCYTLAEYNDVINYYKALRPQIDALIDEIPHVSKSDKTGHHSYIDSFFEIVADNDLFRQEFLDKCESRKLYNLSEK